MNNEYRDNVQEEINRISELHNRCSFDVSIRLGKTFSMLKIASKYKKVLVSYPNEPIYSSWCLDAIKFNIDISHITFTTNISLNKHNLQEYEILICDEFDTLSVSNLEYISDNLPNKLYLFSGTPPLKGSDKRAIIDVIAPIVYTVKLEDTIGHTSKDYSITVHLIDGTKTILPLKSGKTWNEQAKINWLENKYYKSNNWNDMLVLINAIKSSKSKFEYLKKLTKSNDRELIFVETKKQCNELKLPSYYSDNKDSEKNLKLFQENKINKLVTINQLKASITFNNLNKAILLHTYSNYAKAHQKLGRCLTYSENNIADLHILCIKNTIDEKWCTKSLKEFNQSKINYI
jgi:superfamily II DNA or RNA helicase